jgi:hypothetical protein
MRDNSPIRFLQNSVCAIALAAAFIASPLAYAQKPQSTLEERLSAAQFKAYGLDKLSAEELQGLNEWLQGRGAIDSAGNMQRESAGSSSKRRFVEDDSERVAVSANIVGEFYGWNGNTIFKLDNGQEWQQSEAGAYSGPKVSSPAVTIKPKSFSSWLLVLDDCSSCRVSVKRIK